MNTTTLNFAIKLTISALFILSAVSKLYPSPETGLTSFEVNYLYEMGFGETISLFVSRGIVTLELTLGILILFPGVERISIMGSGILLSVFVFHLCFILLTKGNTGSCGCFGELIPMSPFAAIIKNLTAIAGLVYLWNKTEPRPSNLSLLASLPVIAMFLFAFAPAKPGVHDISSFTNGIHSDFLLATDNFDTYSGAPDTVISKFSKYDKYIPGELHINSEKKILCFFAPTCDHCIETAKKLEAIRSESDSFPPMHILFYPDFPEMIPDFFKEVGREYSYRVPDIDTYVEMLGRSNVPAVYYLWNGNIIYEAEGDMENRFKSRKFLKHLLNE